MGDVELCPKCKYDRSDAPRTRCPECGTRLPARDCSEVLFWPRVWGSIRRHPWVTGAGVFLILVIAINVGFPDGVTLRGPVPPDPRSVIPAPLYSSPPQLEIACPDGVPVIGNEQAPMVLRIGDAWAGRNSLYIEVGVRVEFGTISSPARLQQYLHERVPFAIIDSDGIEVRVLPPRPAWQIRTGSSQAADLPTPWIARSDSDGLTTWAVAMYRTDGTIAPGSCTLVFNSSAEDELGVEAGTRVVVQVVPIP